MQIWTFIVQKSREKSFDFLTFCHYMTIFRLFCVYMTLFEVSSPKRSKFFVSSPPKVHILHFVPPPDFCHATGPCSCCFFGNLFCLFFFCLTSQYQVVSSIWGGQPGNLLSYLPQAMPGQARGKSINDPASSRCDVKERVVQMWLRWVFFVMPLTKCSISDQIFIGYAWKDNYTFLNTEA